MSKITGSSIQEINNNIATQIVSNVFKDSIPEIVTREIQDSHQPCRFQKVASNTIVDVCHNQQGFEALFDQLSSEFNLPRNRDQSINVILAASTSKDVSKVIEFLDKQENVKSIHLISRPHGRLSS